MLHIATILDEVLCVKFAQKAVREELSKQHVAVSDAELQHVVDAVLGGRIRVALYRWRF